MSIKDNRIVADASIYIVSTYLAQVITFVTGIITKRLLGPTNVGIWSLVVIVFSYLAVSEFGVIQGAAKEIPFWYGKGDLERANRLKNVMFTFTLAGSLVIAVGMLMVTLFIRHSLALPFLGGLLYVVIFSPIAMVINCYTVLLRSNKKFKLLSSTMIIVAVFTLICAPLLIWQLDIYGMYIATGFIMVLNLCYWIRMTRGQERFTFKKYFSYADFKYLLKFGIPILIGGMTFTFFQTVDSLVIAKMLGTTMLGYYAMAITTNRYIFNTPNAFAIVMFPRFQERYGLTESQESLYNYLVLPTIVLAYFVLPVLIGLAFFIMPLLIIYILPDFTPGILPLKILLSGTFFISLTHMPGQFLITINKMVKTVIFTVIALVIALVLNILAIRWGYGLEGVALATAISYFILFAMGLLYALSRLMNAWKSMGILINTLVPFVYVTVLLWAIDYYINPVMPVLVSDVGFALLKSLMFIILIIPLILYANKKTAVLKRIITTIRKPK